MSNIFITNYPRVSGYSTFLQEGSKNNILEISYGYDYNVNSHEITLQIARDLITAILTFDKIYIEGYNIVNIIQVFGSDYLKELLRLHLLCIIPDQELNPVLFRKGEKWEHGFFSYPQSHVTITNSGNIRSNKPIHKWSHIENWFDEHDFQGKEANTVLYLIDDNGVKIGDVNKITETINQETTQDIFCPQFLQDPNLYRIGKNGTLEYNLQGRIRMQELNKTAVLAATLHIDNIKTDAAIKDLLLRKTSSAFSKEFHYGIDALNHIEQQKGFPDLGKLFVDKIIDLDDILQLRESFHNKIFRYWINNTDYDEKKIRMEVMNSVHNILGSKICNPLRFLGTNIIGICGFLPGLTASAFDSFILDKISKGWHPNFFLDDVLKRRIDKCIEKNNQIKLKEKAANAFKGIGRNDPCPCGSGKKFKKCHGKILF